MANLPLSDIVDVVVTSAGLSTVRSGFNIGCIIGSSTHISASTRTKIYTSLSDMIDDGFATTDAEYKAATLYLGQIYKPNKVVIGRWDKTGTETIVDAITACRNSNSDWYACLVCGATKTEIAAAAGYIETATPTSVLFYTTADSDAKAGTSGNVFLTLKGSSYKRSFGLYSYTTTDAVAAVMGYAMGANTGLINSSYTLAYKTLAGVTVDALTAQEVSNIKTANGNVYINRGMTYNLLEQGIVATGTHFDEILGIDMLTDNIQKSVLDLLTSANKVPLTDQGTALLINAIGGACAQAQSQGFIAPGIWKGAAILNLETGDTLSSGYSVLAEPVSSLSQAQRDAREAPSIYVAICLAGAIESVLINVLVQR